MDDHSNSNDETFTTILCSNDERFEINMNYKCLNSLNYLNQEFVNLGFPSVYLNDVDLSLTKNSLMSSSNVLSIDFNTLIVTIIDFVKRYRTQLPLLEKLQEQCHRLDKDYEIQVKKQIQLKEQNENHLKEIKKYEEKCRQLQIKMNKLNKTVKDETEEIRKLKSLIEQRDTFYKHDRKKIDTEMHKLKEKLQQFITNKSQMYASIDMSDNLNRNSAKQRGTWNSDSSKKQIDIYTHLIKDYENKLKGVVLENSELRQTVANVAIKLYSLCKYSSSKHELDEYIENDNSEYLVNIPFENLNSRIEEYLKLKFNAIEQGIERNAGTNGDQTTENLLNTTFTIDDDENDQSCNEFYDSINEGNKSLNNSKRNSIVAVNVKNTTASQSEIESLKNELDEYKHVIKTQNDLINSFNQNLTLNNDKSISFIEIEANSIIEERTRLAEEKKYYYKQKLQFEEEKLRYNQAILQLAKQRKLFENEKEQFCKQKLYDSFSNSIDVDGTINTTTSRRSISSNKSINFDKK